jgi:hypothetical protein
MSIPIRTQILNEIGARLALMDIAAGYFTTVNKIDRARLEPFNGYDLPALNYWADIDTRIESGGGYEEREFRVLIEYHDKTRDRPFCDVSDELAADVEIALYRSPAAGTVADNPSHALGGLVTGLFVDATQPEIGAGQTPFLGVILNLSITYKRRPDEPFTIVT